MRHIVFIIFVFSLCLYTVPSYAQVADQKSATPIISLNDGEILALMRDVMGKDNSVTQLAFRKLRKMDHERVVSAVAYAIEHDDLFDTAFQVILFLPCKDQRLAPFLAQRMQITERDKLLDVLHLAEEIPSKAYLDPLFEHALQNNYFVQHKSSGPGGHVSFFYHSVLGYAANILYKCTGGEIGINGYGNHQLPPTGEKFKEFIKPWRLWWEAQHEDDFHDSARNGNLRIVQAELAAYPPLLNMQENGETALFKASAAGELAVVEYLTAQGADVNIPDANGKTAVQVAGEQKHRDIANFLSQHGAIVKVDPPKDKQDLEPPAPKINEAFNGEFSQIQIYSQPFYLEEQPIPIAIECKVGQSQKLILSYDAFIPQGMQLLLLDHTGKEATRFFDPTRPSLGPPLPVNLADAYSMAPGETILFSCDLSKFYQISKPGTYKAQIYIILNQERKILAEADIVILPTDIFSVYTRTATGADLTTIKTTFDKNDYWYLVIADLENGGYGRNPAIINSRTISIPARVTIEKVVRDKFSRLWIVLTSDGKSALIILEKGFTSYRMSGWENNPIELDTTVDTLTKAPLAIAGRHQGEKITSTYYDDYLKTHEASSVLPIK